MFALSRLKWLALLPYTILLLACSTQPSNDTYYTIKNGMQVACNQNTCVPPVYVHHADGSLSYCTGSDPGQDCTKVTPTPCSSHYTYDQILDKGQPWKVVQPEQISQNASNLPETVTYTSTTSHTVTITDTLGVTSGTRVSGGVSVMGIQAAVAQSVQTSLKVSVSTSVTATTGISNAFTIPAGETAYAIYGVKMQATNGHLYDAVHCTAHSDWGTDTVYTPIGEGWCIWTSKQQQAAVCPTVP